MATTARAHAPSTSARVSSARAAAPARVSFPGAAIARKAGFAPPSVGTVRASRQQAGALKASRVVNAAATAPNMQEVIEALVSGTDLTEEQTMSALEAVVTGGDAAQISAFLVLLRAKGETSAEVAGLARGMKNMSVKVHLKEGMKVVDIVGTGGDGIGSVNISTGASILCAAAGAKVAKHGNRSVSSLCGSADVLEALGVAVDIGPEGVARCVEEAGIGFMFAPRFHPAMAAVVPVRKALKVRTAFNILGPMLNPADAPYALVGVYGPSVSQLMAESLQRLGTKKALVVHSLGLDELTPMGIADVWEVTQDGVRQYEVEPLDFGIKRCEVEDLKGGDAQVNAQILMDTFAGQKGAVADALILNAGVALAACETAKDVPEGIAMAQEAHRLGKGADTLKAWAALSTQIKSEE
mmetsp:Transcript_8750/g.28878  ORF Transcript_8750/g.28878 Transcript_8750/m.28878 type:complete len:412 (-) Transcript_8750:89-1324(-)